MNSTHHPHAILLRLLSVAAFLVSTASLAQASESSGPWNVRNFGVVPDNDTVQTKAIQSCHFERNLRGGF